MTPNIKSVEIEGLGIIFTCFGKKLAKTGEK